MALGSTLDSAGATLDGMLNKTIINAVRSPIDGILSGLPGGRILPNMYTNLVPSSIGELASGPEMGPPEMGGMPSISHIGTGKLFPADTLKLPVEFVKIREEFIKAFAKATQIPSDSLREFLEIVESLVSPGRKVVDTDVSDFLVEMKIVHLFATLDADVLESFRDTFAKMRKLLPGPSNSEFMGLPNLGLLEDVRKNVINGAFTKGPLANLRQKATLYVSGVFPMIGKLIDVDALLGGTALEFGKALDIEVYPIDSLARLIDFKMRLITEAVDFKVDAMKTLVEITEELITSAVELIPVVKDLVLLIPQITIDILMELVSIAAQVGSDVIDIKLAAIEWVTTIPLEVVDSILDVKVEVLDDLEFAKLDVLQGIWEQAQEMLETYNNYTGFLGLSIESFPLEYFGNLSRDLVLRTSGILDGTDAPTDDATTTDAPTDDATTNDAPTDNATTTDAPTDDATTTDITPDVTTTTDVTREVAVVDEITP